MGQKVHPYGFRVGYNKDWHSHWFAKQEFATFLAEDLKLKRDLKRRFSGGGVSHIDIERAATRLKIIIYTARPGIIIGRKGAEIENDAEVSAAKEASTHTTAEEHAEAPADEAMEVKDEELERQ